MAVACGLTAANLIYYAQPLLGALAQSFGVSAVTAGLIVAMTQFGYVLGLAFIVPLDDLLERQRLIAIVLLGTIAALILVTLSPTIGIFLFASLAIGLTSVVAQILAPFSAHLATGEQRGAIVGRVMSGLLLGILLARAASGFIADMMGWRMIFWLAAAFMLLQIVILWYTLPQSRGESDLVKTRKTKRFIDKAVDDFTIFGLPIHSLDQKLKQMPKGPICIRSIAVNKNNISSIFFSFKVKPEDKIVLKMNGNFEYLPLEKVGFKVTGKIALKGIL